MKKKGIVLTSVILILFVSVVVIFYCIKNKTRNTSITEIVENANLIEAASKNELTEQESLEIIKEEEEAEIKNKERFAKYFDENITNHEFLINNPMLFSPDYYYPNLNPLKGKYIYREHEMYGLWADKVTKTYGDSNGWSLSKTLYKFDLAGRLTVMYYVDQEVFQDGSTRLSIIKYTTYEYKKDKYIETVHDLKNGWVTATEYTINEEDDKLIIERKNEYGQIYQTIFEKGKISNLEWWSKEKLSRKEEYFFYENKVKNIEYGYRNSINEIDEERLYENGELKKWNRVIPNGGLDLRLYEITNGTKGVYKKKYKRDEINFEEELFFERIFNEEAGFLEYSKESPIIDGDSGNYDFETRKIVDKPDDFFVEHFGSLLEDN